VTQGVSVSASPPLTSAFSFYLPYAIRNATILKRISHLSLSQRENGLFARDSGICLGASVDTRYYYSWPRLLSLLDLDKDSSRGKEYEQGKAIRLRDVVTYLAFLFHPVPSTIFSIAPVMLEVANPRGRAISAALIQALPRSKSINLKDQHVVPGTGDF
jgi:hypothetical protein